MPSAEHANQNSLGRRGFLGLMAGAITVPAFLLDDPAMAAIGEEALGTPIVGVTNAGAGYTVDAGGRPIVTVIAGGDPSHFSALDAITGERLSSLVLPGVKQSWSFVTAPDRRVYIGTQSSGEVWRFDPDDLALTRIGTKPFGQTHMWAGVVDSRGHVVFGTYPDGKLISYSAETDQWQDYGRIDPQSQYIRSVATWRDFLYSGTGARAKLFRTNIVDGSTIQILLPAEYAGQEFVYDLNAAGTRLFARVTPASTLLVYDLEREKWVNEIPGVVGLAVSPAGMARTPAGMRREAYYSPTSGPVMAYDLDADTTRPIDLNLTGAAARAWAWMPLGLRGFPGRSLVTANSKARIHAWNPLTGEVRQVAGDAAGTPFIIRSLSTGPDGAIYAGGYLSPPGLSRFDPSTGRRELLPGAGQIEGFTAHGNDLVFGTYPGGNLFRFDTTAAWAYGTNPGPRLVIGHEQDRPVALTAAGTFTAVGTAPNYGQLGGALTLYDRSAGTLEVFRNVVTDQTPICLAYRDGLIYGGTGIWGGLGIDPTTAEGHLFIFDIASRSVVYSGVPVPGEATVSALAFDDVGMLWGLTGNYLFRFDPATREVTLSRKYFDINDGDAYWTGRELFWHNGTLVGNTARRLFEIDPVTLDITILATGADNLAIDGTGRYYFNRGSELFRWNPA